MNYQRAETIIDNNLTQINFHSFAKKKDRGRHEILVIMFNCLNSKNIRTIKTSKRCEQDKKKRFK